ncbi:MAG: glycerol-3-phosphate 1-O-acyltransferase PlsY [Cytophagaceae bacterium]|nr:glycerol-3-phosphate 1-O-acyltransferase PlsY [Cytophagaceae bacterium]
MEMTFILGIIGAYLIGSIPTAVWYGKAFYGIDVRDYGSGNAGATNSFRVLGKKAGVIVMLADILKGWFAAQAAIILYHLGYVAAEDLILYQSAFGIMAVLGHIFPVYAKFKGGKGIATLLGMVLSIHIEAALICMLIFFIVLIISKYVSLGSLLASLAFPLVLLMPRFYPDEPFLIAFGFVIFFIVVITHQKNIVRLIHGEENKAKIRIRKKR